MEKLLLYVSHNSHIIISDNIGKNVASNCNNHDGGVSFSFSSVVIFIVVIVIVPQGYSGRNVIRICWDTVIQRTIPVVFLFCIPFVQNANTFQHIMVQLPFTAFTIISIQFLWMDHPKVLIKIWRNPNELTKLLRTMIMPQTIGTGNDRMARLPNSVQYFCTIIIIGPIVEEMIYRCKFDQIWHSSSSTMIRSRIPGGSDRKKVEDDDDANHQHHPPSKNTELWLGHQRPRILMSSSYFGLVPSVQSSTPQNPDTVRSAATM
mmetsp:Transcript_41970/g.48482  ORF Transcript_41970/g.48482 Transcript_41970/m.48482 type:complete len:262 (-) Transcript_41970:366-1151(-)